MDFSVREEEQALIDLARKGLTVIFEELIPRIRNPKLVGAPRRLVSSFIPGIKASTAAVLGGIGNAPGAMLGRLPPLWAGSIVYPSLAQGLRSTT